MKTSATSIRPFIGAKNFEESRSFYQALGFRESVISSQMSYFQVNNSIGFYLQNAYVKDWVDNTMVFVEVTDVDTYYQELLSFNLTSRFSHSRLVPVRIESWGKECFLHDPSGVLWHFGQFNS
ncbi:MAG: glyoxalase [Cyclobacteriaceae bacterium]|nr:glyoxalase [Cyclobacteriaceae bacterium]